MSDRERFQAVVDVFDDDDSVVFYDAVVAVDDSENSLETGH